MSDQRVTASKHQHDGNIARWTDRPCNKLSEVPLKVKHFFLLSSL